MRPLFLVLPIVLVACASNPVREQIVRLHDEHHVAPNASYVADEIFNDEYMNQLVPKVCGYKRGHGTEKQQAECKNKVLDVFYARLHERYPYADPNVAENHCAADPVSCSSPKQYEDWMRKAQNDYLEDSKQRQLASYEASKTPPNYQAISQSLMDFSKSLRPNHPSNQLKNPIGQQCVHRADGFGNVVSECR